MVNPEVQPKNPETIKGMFSKVADSYDKANSVLSLGIHHLWRKKLVRISKVREGDKVLDCATGTGDLAIEFKKAVGPQGQVIGTDFCEPMLYKAPDKAAYLNLDITFEVADVMKLPYGNSEFDLTSISFGIRNVENPVQALSEMARVTKSDGYVMVLEFGQIDFPIVGPMYKLYSESILPKIGGAVTGEKKAYEYLQKSSAKFPCKQEFVNLIMRTGKFSNVEWYPVSFGIAYIYKAKVI